MTSLRNRLQPADKIVLAYFALMVAVETARFSAIPEASWLIALHVIGAALIVLAARMDDPGAKSGTNRLVWIFRHWYPLLFVAACYREMAILILDLRHSRFDQALADLDFSIWGVHPSVWMEHLYTPAFTEFLQLIYTLFVPVALLPAAIIWVRRDYAQFRYMAFLLSLGFLVSYFGYIALPARGPRYLLEHLQHAQLRGLWLFDLMQATLNRLEKEHYDCFPSGHTELTIIAWALSRRISLKLFGIYGVYTLLIVFSTVYLRYHYTVDLFAGAATALALIYAAPLIYRRLTNEGDPIGD